MRSHIATGLAYKGTREGTRTAVPFDEIVEEAIVVGGMREDLPTQEAVFVADQARVPDGLADLRAALRSPARAPA